MSEATGGMFSGHSTKGRVLVVDDEPDVRDCEDDSDQSWV